MRSYKFSALVLTLVTAIAVPTILLINQHRLTECPLPLEFRWDVIWRDIPVVGTPWLLLAIQHFSLWRLRAAVWFSPAISGLLCLLAIWVIEEYLRLGYPRCDRHGDSPLDALYFGSILFVYPWMLVNCVFWTMARSSEPVQSKGSA